MASETNDPCRYCHGEGWRWEYDVFEGQDGPEEDTYEIPCNRCNPSGRIDFPLPTGDTNDR